ncbi:PEP-CTERM sorting domain-containing protein [Polymorphobacter arshaanensis]|uniref:PEP-CTERM sorting domain-containing protein n=2 Tax=Glacieibacterium arshaanense TaxID=2511025 RepID=A0A4Y9EJS3_9SPHN|nr:PEP-CTERM sorting domain-containing protein [Polymorphobacter arshaanensis]
MADAVDSVPEPASWAMMITGFGLIGGTLRRRRTTLATTTC